MRPIHIILLLQAFICVTIIQSGAPPFPTPEDDESLFRAMFEAQDKYRQGIFEIEYSNKLKKNFR